MGSYKLWDEDTYIVHKYRVNQMYDHCRSRCFELEDIASRTFVCNNHTYNADGRLATCIDKFQKTTARLNALLQAMNSYYAEYTGMLESSQGTMDEVDVSNQMYGSFEAILAGSAAATAAVYAGSSAYQFHQAGFSFSNDFNDAEIYMSEDYFQHFEVLEAASLVGSWDTLTLDLLFSGNGPTDYSQELMENALLSSLAAVPVYGQQEDMDISSFLADTLGIPDLESELSDILSWFNKKVENGEVDGLVNQLCEKLEKMLREKGCKNPVAMEMIESLSSKAFLLEFFGKFASWGLDITKGAEFLVNTWAHLTANHIQQLSYLESIENALATCGYQGGSLLDTIDQLKENFESAESYVWDMCFDKIEETVEQYGASVVDGAFDDMIMGVCKKVCPSLAQFVPADFSPLAGANVFLDGVSGAVDFVAGDLVNAVETLRGIQMYTTPLISSYESYMRMMDAGIATAEDVAQAENLFELIRASKMKEYECIQTLDMYGYWHDLAKEKYDQLADWGPAVWEEIGLTENPLLAGRRDDTKL